MEYCFILKDVCCVACLSVDIHRQHSDQVKSVVDVANEEKKILKKHLEKIEKLQSTLIDEQHQLEEKLQSKTNPFLRIFSLLLYVICVDVATSEA